MEKMEQEILRIHGFSIKMVFIIFMMFRFSQIQGKIRLISDTFIRCKYSN